jgi:hypothetical protein
MTVNIAKSRFTMNASEGNFLSNADFSGLLRENRKRRMHADPVPADASAPCRGIGTPISALERFTSAS